MKPTTSFVITIPQLGFPQFVITQKISSWAMKGSASSIDKTVRQDPVGRKRATSAPD
jgi:hypothetical protein